MVAAQQGAGFGIVTVCAGVFSLATMDALAKWLGEFYPVSQLIFFRNLFALPAVFVLAMSTGGLRRLWPERLWLHLLRGVLALAAVGFFFLALRTMPLASAWTIAFSGPLMVTALTPLLLGERVGVLRWTSVLVGFGGVLIVLRPGGGVFEWTILLPLGTAFCESLLVLLARRYAESEDAASMVASTVVFPLIITGFAMPEVWIDPAPVHWPAFFTLGTLGGSALIFLTLAYRMVEAPILAPFDYTALIWSVLWGWLIWRDWPDAATWIGAVVIVGSGLFILYRETVRRPSGKGPIEHETSPVEP